MEGLLPQILPQGGTYAPFAIHPRSSHQLLLSVVVKEGAGVFREVDWDNWLYTPGVPAHKPS